MLYSMNGSHQLVEPVIKVGHDMYLSRHNNEGCHAYLKYKGCFLFEIVPKGFGLLNDIQLYGVCFELLQLI